MPNWCNTEVIFEGENALKLYKDWEKAEETNKTNRFWLGNLFNYKKITGVPIRRIYINDIEYDKKTQTTTMRIEEEWDPAIEVYEKIAEIYKLKFYLLAEEPDGEIFVNTDTEGKYFTEKYYFEFYNNNEEIENNLIRVLKELDDIMYFDSFNEIHEYLKDYNINTEEDMEYFCEYIREKYPDYVITFGKFINPYQEDQKEEGMKL
jgi:hypothetical protein